MTILGAQGLFIDGKLTASESGGLAPFVSEGVEAKTYLASEKDLRNCVESSLRGVRRWEVLGGLERGRVLLTLAQEFEQRQGEILRSLTVNSSSCVDEVTADLGMVAEAILFLLGACDKLSEIIGQVNLDFSHQFTEAVPLGVVAVLTSTQLSLGEFLTAVISCVAAGNCVIACCEPRWAPYIRVLADLLLHSRVPDGVINLLCGQGNKLFPHVAAHPMINGVCAVNLSEDHRIALSKESTHDLKRIWNHEAPKSLQAIANATIGKTYVQPELHV